MPVTSHPVTSRTARTISVVFFGTLIVLFLIYEAQVTARSGFPYVPGGTWAWYATYALIGTLFFAVGALVWRYGYARQHTVATLLFWFCILLTLAFASLSGAASNDHLSNAIGASCSALAVFCLFLLLLRFPHNLLPQRAGPHRAMVLFQVVVGILSLLSASSSILNDAFALPPPEWWYFLGEVYYSIAGLLAVLIIALAMRTSPSMRTLQQSRLFFAGTLLATVPIILLTIVPTMLHLQASINGTRSMVCLVFIPIALAYSLLRYELLVFDSYIRKIVTWMIGGVGIALLGYSLFAISSQLIGGNEPLLLASLIGIGVLLSPYVWWLARHLTERFFFPETVFYATRLKEARAHQGVEMFDLQLAAHTLILSIITTLQAPEACIFVLDEEGHSFRLLSLPQRETARDTPGEWTHANTLPEVLGRLLSPTRREAVPCIAEESPAIAILSASHRPLFLSEMWVDKGTGIARYVKNSASSTENDPLLAPIRTTQEKVIGLVVLAQRGDGQLYAGPELEVLQHLTDRSASAIETARGYEITTRQQAASRRELEQAYEQQKQLSEQKDQFIIHVSHELRTPLSELTGYLDLLVEAGEELNPELRTLFVEKARHGSGELQRLIESILDAAQSSFASPLPLHIEAVDLAVIIRKVLSHLEPQMARDHEITVQSDEGLRVYADAHALQLILQNLLSNALKYTDPGTSIAVRTTTQLPSEDAGSTPMVRVEVQDKGPGIPPSEVSALFEKFARLQRDISGSIRGTGLGLYINRQLVESMGGRIWLESSGIPGEGSVFSFTLRQAETFVSSQQVTQSPLGALALG